MERRGLIAILGSVRECAIYYEELAQTIDWEIVFRGRVGEVETGLSGRKFRRSRKSCLVDGKLELEAFKGNIWRGVGACLNAARAPRRLLGLAPHSRDEGLFTYLFLRFILTRLYIFAFISSHPEYGARCKARSSFVYCKPYSILLLFWFILILSRTHGSEFSIFCISQPQTQSYLQYFLSVVYLPLFSLFSVCTRVRRE